MCTWGFQDFERSLKGKLTPQTEISFKKQFKLITQNTARVKEEFFTTSETI